MKTKELLSLPVGKYICTDRICNYLYRLEVKKSSLWEGVPIPRFIISIHNSSILSPDISFDRTWIDDKDHTCGKTWKGTAYLGGLRLVGSDFSQEVGELQIVCPLKEKDDLLKYLKNFLIERICNTSNSDYRKRFLQDKLKQIIKNAKGAKI